MLVSFSSFPVLLLSDYCKEKSCKRRAVKVSLMTVAQGKQVVFMAFSRRCRNDLPVLEASNTTSFLHMYYLFNSIHGHTLT